MLGTNGINVYYDNIPLGYNLDELIGEGYNFYENSYEDIEEEE